jgi:hypothetical protein
MMHQTTARIARGEGSFGAYHMSRVFISEGTGAGIY